MTPILNPQIDVIFKNIFGSTGSEDILMSLVNSILSQEDQVESLTIMNPYNLQNSLTDKLSELDIKAKCHNGTHLNIEMQIRGGSYYGKRSLYYWSRVYGDQMQEAHEYKILCKTIGIHLCSRFTVTNSEKYHSSYIMKEKQDNSLCEDISDIEMHYIELDKFVKQQNSETAKSIEVLQNSLEQWTDFLANYEAINTDESKKQKLGKYVKKALDKLNIISMSPEGRSAFEARLKQIRDEEDITSTKVENARLEEKRTMAQKMLLEKESIEKIINYTDLSREDIEKLL